MKPDTSHARSVGQMRCAYTIETLRWRDVSMGVVETPTGPMRITLGLGSGLALRPGGHGGIVWAIGDRGPNLKVSLAIEAYGLSHLSSLAGVEGAKIMPRPDIGPMICKLKLDGNSLQLLDTLPLRDQFGRPISGLPLPQVHVKSGKGVALKMEPAFALDGSPLGADPSGADTESFAILKDGSFWVGDEYGPSLLHVGPDGKVLRRWVPKGTDATFHGAHYPVEPVLPKIAARRRLNRGFEALAVSADEKWLYVVFQSALVIDEDDSARPNRFARIWKINAASGKVVAQFLYPFDAPSSFKRDGRNASRADLKLCEACVIGPDRLLLLERISQTGKLYIVDLKKADSVPSKYLKARTQPSLEAMNMPTLRRNGVPILSKRMILSTDDAPKIGPDLEGVAVLSPTELILVSDNDFGVAKAKTGFWKVTFDEAVLA